MGKVEIKYVKSYADRHGKMRHYFRRKGEKQIPLPGDPGSTEFMEAYADALSGKEPVGAAKTAPGSVAALCVAYYASPGYRGLQPQTRRTYRAIIEKFRAEAGDLPVDRLAPKHFRAVFDRMEHQGAANVMRKRLRHLMQFAVERDWRPDNPLLAISKPKYTPKPFLPWSEDEISAFEAHWPSGSRERLALALLLYTGQRRGDVVRMGRQHTRNGRIAVTQGKTKTRLEIKIHPALKVELDHAKNDLTFLMTQLGKPFSPAGFSQWFADRAKLAGIEQRSPHGLRKAAARRLAEAGCSAHEIASITGHKSLSEVENYTRDANQKRLGDEAIDTLVRAEKGTATV
jgi:integrase